MPKQALWDIYESALMLDTYFRIECGEISLKEAILDLSAKLRRKAIRNGDIIDDVYRNPNGISTHLGHMKYALTDGKEGLSHGAKIYSEIVRIYRQEPEKYAQILQEAESMVSEF